MSHRLFENDDFLCVFVALKLFFEDFWSYAVQNRSFSFHYLSFYFITHPFYVFQLNLFDFFLLIMKKSPLLTLRQTHFQGFAFVLSKFHKSFQDSHQNSKLFLLQKTVESYKLVFSIVLHLIDPYVQSWSLSLD